MSYHAMGWAARQSGLSPTNKLVLIMLAERADRDTDIAFPSYETMAKDCGLSRRSCISAIAWLAENGYVKVVNREAKGRPTSNAYKVQCGQPVDLATKSRSERAAPPDGEPPALVNVLHHPVVNDVHHRSERAAPPDGEPPAPEQVTSKPIIEPLSAQAAPARALRFEEFWNAYPHRNGTKKGRKPAEAKYRAAVKCGVPEQALIDGARAAWRHPDVLRGFARDPTTWLNQAGWEDSVTTHPPPTADPKRTANLDRLRRIAASYQPAKPGGLT